MRRLTQVTCAFTVLAFCAVLAGCGSKKEEKPPETPADGRVKAGGGNAAKLPTRTD